MEFDSNKLAASIAATEGFDKTGITNAIRLMDEGNTLPFIARYRKEGLRGLDETGLRLIEDAVNKAKELAARKKTVLSTIEGLGQLTPKLRKKIEDCEDKNLLEDIYLPFKPKRRNKATLAREQGLEPLAQILLEQKRMGRTRKSLLADYVDPEKGVDSGEEAYAGAANIVAEVWSEDTELRTWLFEEAQSGAVVAKVKRGKKEEGKKFEKLF